METIIKVENVSKRFRLGTRQAAYGTLREALMNSVRAPFGKWRNATEVSQESLWALRGVSFEIGAGEVVGIIGRNGAGKSTLLKILSRIIEPTGGRAELFGRVGSLLEVGTGFHSELSGRENIFLSGAILGMKRAEIKRKFDEIVSFAEIDKFVDTPVKRYSSGIYMRLAFAVAAHLEPEILLVDEVLAVGDAQFQKKCLGKMSEVAHHGRTVLFVSHNMTAVNQLCPRTILLADGRVERDGSTQEVIAAYLQSGRGGSEYVWKEPSRAPGNDRVRLAAVRVVCNGAVRSEVNIDDEVNVEVEFWNYVPNVRNICVNIFLLDGVGNPVLSTGNTAAANLLQDDWYHAQHRAGLYRATCTFPANFLNDGTYYITVYILSLGPMMIEVDAPQVVSFDVFDTGVMREPGGGTGRWLGAVRPRLPWRTSLVKPLDSEPSTVSDETPVRV